MDTIELIDNLWVIFCTMLVFIMQAGFLSLEAGLTRSKNNINVAIKNIADFFVAAFLYFLIGYGLMYGDSVLGLWGGSRFFPTFSSMTEQTFFLFQVMFVSTTVTIISGAIAERVRFQSYIWISIIVSALIYPVFGHWVWGNTLPNASPGWLGSLGFYDFAGGTVVHALGGWVALAVLIIIGPRTGRFDEDGTVNEIHGSNLVRSTFGTLLLVLGWFGFNGGSVYGFNSETISVLFITGLGATSGMVTILAYSLFFKSHVSVPDLINGILVGLVAITPGADVLSNGAALFCGAVGAILMLGTSRMLERLKIDDAIDAIPVHLVGGLWGTLAIAFLVPPEILGTGLSTVSQIGAQLVGILASAVWGFFPTIVILLVINRFAPLRVSLEDEAIGLNISEHAASTDLVSFLTVLDTQARSGDTSLRVPVEPFTEVSQIADRYNAVMENLEEKQNQLSTILTNTPISLFSTDAQGAITIIEGDYFDQLGIKLNHSIYAILEHDGGALQNIFAVFEGENREWITKIGGRFVLFRCQPKKDELGVLDGITGIATDLTEQHKSDMSRDRYVDMLSTSAQISEQVTTILDQKELVETILPLIRRKYSLYHAAVLLVDYRESRLNFTFGSDERSQLLQQTRQSIPLEHPHSLIARAARLKRVVLVNNVSVEPNYYRHPLFIDTQSELVIPLMVHNQFIGVLDIQQNRVNAFEETDVDLFVTIGRQLAIAFNNASLFEKLQNSEHNLQAALDQAVESDKAKDQFLARVSHELRTPLGVILGYAEMMQDEMYGDVSGDQFERLDDIIKSSRHLTELVNQLLNSAKLNSGKITPMLKVFDLRELVSTIFNQMNALASQKNLTFQFEYSDQLPEYIQSDPTLIRQILINLLGNAIKFTDKGAVALSVHKKDSSKILFEIKDTGIGIPKAYQSKVFDPFQQVDGSMTRPHQGTGLGLAITKRIIEILGGEINLISFEGRGSQFTVELPFVYDAKELPNTQPSDSQNQEKLKINDVSTSYSEEKS